MKGTHMLMAALAMLTVVPGGLPAVVAADAWTGQTFLSDYDKLQLVEGREGRDYVYLREVDPERMGEGPRLRPPGRRWGPLARGGRGL